MPCVAVLITGFATCACNAGSAIAQIRMRLPQQCEFCFGLRHLALPRLPARQHLRHPQARLPDIHRGIKLCRILVVMRRIRDQRRIQHINRAKCPRR